MTIKELIAELQKYPEDTVICAETHCCAYDIDAVRIVELPDNCPRTGDKAHKEVWITCAGDEYYA